jgi:hypothetical protein
MKIELFTNKTVKQCTTELNARFEEKETKSRPAVGGYVEKGGNFMLTTSGRVLFLNRVTRLKGTLTKEKDLTLIQGYVSDGVPTEKVGIIMLALGFVALTMLLKGQAIFAILVGAIAVGAYITLIGDYTNSTYLLKELKRMTGAKDKPPVAGAVLAKAPAKSTGGRVTAQSATVKKPTTTSTKKPSTPSKPATPIKKTASASPTKPASKTTSKPTPAKKTSTSKGGSLPLGLRQK